MAIYQFTKSVCVGPDRYDAGDMVEDGDLNCGTIRSMIDQGWLAVSVPDEAAASDPLAIDSPPVNSPDGIDGESASVLDESVASETIQLPEA